MAILKPSAHSHDTAAGEETAEFQIHQIITEALEEDGALMDWDQSFVAQGGDSILAIKVLAKCRQAGFPVSIPDLMSTLTISELCQQWIQDFVETEPETDESEEKSETGVRGTGIGANIISRIWLQTTREVEPNVIHSALIGIFQKHHDTTRENHLNGKAANANIQLQFTVHQEMSPTELTRSKLGDEDEIMALKATLFMGGDEPERHQRLCLEASRDTVDLFSWHTILRELHHALLGHPGGMQNGDLANGHAIQDMSKEESDTRRVILTQEITEKLLSGSQHEIMRTNAADIVHAALLFSLHGKRSLERSTVHSIRNNRLQGNEGETRKDVGCFDELSSFEFNCNGKEDEMAILRRCKDASRGLIEPFDHQDIGDPTVSPMAKSSLTDDNIPLLLDMTGLEAPSFGGKALGYVSMKQDASELRDRFSLVVMTAMREGHLICDLTFGSQWKDSECDRSIVTEEFESSIPNIMSMLDSKRQYAPTLSDFPALPFSYKHIEDLVYKKLSGIVSRPLEDLEGTFPCSKVQKSLLISRELDEKRTQCTFILKVNMDQGKHLTVESLILAWQRVVQRQPMLRTVFVDTLNDDVPFVQAVLRKVDPKIEVLGRENLEEVMFNTQNAPTLPRNEPQHLLSLIQTETNEVYIRLDIHHAIVDGQSAELLLHEIALAYNGEFDGNTPFGYDRFVTFEAEQSKRHLTEFWSGYLSDAEPSQLVQAAESKADQKLKTIGFRISIADQKLDKLCAQYNVTTSSICQLAWGLVLRCLLSTDNICFYYVASDRDAPLNGIQSAIGPFISTLPSKLNLTKGIKVGEAMQTIVSNFARSRDHRYIQPDIFRDGQSSGTTVPWGDTMMAYQRSLSDDALMPGGLKLDVIDAYSPTDFNVALFIRADSTAIQVRLDHWDPAVSDTQGALLAKLFRAALGSILDGGGDSMIMDLTLFGEEDKKMIQSLNSETTSEIRTCIHHRVEWHSKRRPEATAVCAWDGELTYKTLWKHSQRIAHYLIDKGVGPEVKVGLCMDKSKWAIVAMLAILRAGGAIVPLGVQYPLARVDTIVKDTKLKVLLVDENQEGRLQGVVPYVAVPSEEWLDSLPSPTLETDLPNVSPDTSAWVIYTSGSTGVPKGVVLQHNGICTSLDAQRKAFGLGPDTRGLQFSAFTFDVNITETFGILWAGGCICIPSEEDRVNRISEFMSSDQTSVGFAMLTSTVASLVLPSQVPKLKTLVFVGEAPKPEVVEKWLGSVTMFNAYGPAESSIFVSVTEITGVQNTFNIGYPYVGYFWIAEAENINNLAPIGTIGELLLEGPLLSRGYHNNPKKTAEAFITDPGCLQALGLGPGRRVYRTGDLAIQSEDGSITYLGRKDNQIKIRGQRLEVGEIEYFITQHSTVNDAIVLYPKDGPVANKLVVFVTFHGCLLNGGRASSVIEADEKGKDAIKSAMPSIRSYLLDRILPDMIPNLWIPLSAVPVNLSSKTDRLQLTQWLSGLDSDKLDSLHRVVDDAMGQQKEPQTDIERQVQEICAHALHKSASRVSMGLSFLALGGDSVTAMQVVSHCRERGLNVRVRDIIRSSSLTQLCTLVEYDEQEAETEGNNLEDNKAGHFSLTDLSEEELAQIERHVITELGLDGFSAIEDVYSCSPLQEGVLLTQIKDPSAYQTHHICDLRTTDPSRPVRSDQLVSTWQQIVDRHSILRTGFIELDSADKPFYQVVFKSWDADVVVVKCERNELDDLISNSQHVEYHNSRPCHRLTIFETTQGDVSIVLDINHALCDAASFYLILQELKAIHDDRLEVGGASLYRDYIAYLQTLSSEEDDLSYWKQALIGFEPCHLSLDSPPSVIENSGSGQQVNISLPNLSSLQRLRDMHGVTLANVFQLAWGMVLSTHTGSPRPSFGYLVNGRDAPIPRAQGIVGPLINTLPCAMSIQYDESVSDSLKRLQDDFFQALDHSRTSLASIHNAIGYSESGLFNTLISFQRGSDKPEERPYSLVVDNVRGTDATEYDATVIIVACEHRVDITLDYKASFTDKKGATRLLNALQATAQQLAENHDRQLSCIQTASSAELDQINSWNRDWDPAIQSCVHEMVSVQSSSRPDAPAICAWDGELTYKMLWDQSQRVAHYLSNRGVGPEVKVGICFDKSKSAIVAMLSILQAGGTVVPLGMKHPVRQIEMIVSESEISIILVDEQQADRLNGTVPELLMLTDTWLKSLPSQVGDVSSNVRPANSAWVFYTSGSTGTPKGVVLEHMSLCTSLQAQGRKLGMDHHTRSSQFAAYTFDVSIQDIFTTLTFGGCVCIMSEEDRMNNLTQSLDIMRVNSAALTPTVAGILNPDDVPSLKRLILAGEALPESVISKWDGRVEIRNCYGPTECSIYASYSSLLTRESNPGEIGLPMAGCFWVTNPDNYHQLSPIGVPGELMVEGPLLARGYLNDPVKTSTSFVTDPSFINTMKLGSGHRMYRTGDLVKQKEDGSLIFIGRKDNQIKIRGQRVEIGEIEHNIRKNHCVQEAVVVYSQEGVLSNSLTAFMVLRHSSPRMERSTEIIEADEEMKMTLKSEVSAIQQTLNDSVLSYMVPQVWIPLAALPVNQSGKTDRLRLVQWLRGSDANQLNEFIPVTEDHADELSPPTSEMEALVQEICAKVLNISPKSASMARSFLGIGGDSVTAMQVVSSCRAQNISLRVRDILQSKSLRELASKAKYTKEQIFEEASSAAFSLTPVQELYFRHLAPSETSWDEENRFNQVVCVRVNDDIPKEDFVEAMDRVVEKHGMLRARFEYQEEKGWQQFIIPDTKGSYRFQSSIIEDEMELQRVFKTAQNSLNVDHGPVFSVDMIHQKGTQFLFFVAHHLVMDIVSWRIILGDLGDVLEEGKLSVPRSLSFQHWQEMQSKFTERFSQHPSKTLPFNVPEPDWGYWGIERGNSFQEDQIERVVLLGEDTTSKLFDVSNRSMQTEPIEILLAGLFRSFAITFPDRDVPAIFNEGHGREPWEDSIDLSNTVGWFTTMTPIHVSDTSNSLITLQQTKDTRRAIPQIGLPYFASRFQTEIGRQLFKDHDFPEILVNYVGKFQQAEREDALFTFEGIPDLEVLAPAVGEKVPSWSVFDLNISVTGNMVKIALKHSRQIKYQDRISQWLENYQQCMEDLTAELARMNRVHTISDFPLADVTMHDLEIVEKELLPSIGLQSLDDVETISSCSPFQVGILFSHMRNPSSYQTRHVYTLRSQPHASPIESQELVSCWQKVVKRHGILRTAFAELSSRKSPFHQIVLRSWHGDTQIIQCEESQIEAMMSQLKPMELDGYRPCHRLSVLQSEEKLTVVLDISHALCDATSLQLLMQDLIQAYDKTLPETQGYSYGSYIGFLRETSADEALDYWKMSLSDQEPCHMTSPLEGTKLQSEPHCLEKTSTHTIKDLSQLHSIRDNHSITLANIFQLAWGVVLSRYTGLNNVCFGFLMNGRDTPIEGVQEIVGPMTNMVPCRVSVDQKPIAEALKQMQEQFLQSVNHQRVSLATIHNALGISENGLFNTVLSFKRGVETQALHTKSVLLEDMRGYDATDYDIFLDITSTTGSVEVAIKYRESFIDERIANDLLLALEQVVRQFSEPKKTSLGKLHVLSNAERAHIMGWNNKTIAKPVLSLVHEKIYAQYQKQPNSIAISAWDGELSYSSLWNQAQKIAAHLITVQVGPEVKVGLCMDKSKWAIVSMLAILQAGGTVVPLGVKSPLTRLETIVKDTEMRVIIADEHQFQRLQSLVPVLFVPTEFSLDQLHPPATNANKIGPRNAAWIIYTSGSTGVPKGVVLEHASLCTSLEAHGNAFRLNQNTKGLQFSAFTFDISIADSLGVLYCGGCVCVPSEEERLNHLTKYMNVNEVNFAMLTSTVAGLLEPSELPALKLLAFIGEAPKPEVVGRWQIGSTATIVNGYGPAECTIGVSVTEIKDKKNSLNIGCPMSGGFWVAQANDYNILCPVGVPGELLIEGPLLSRGYLNDPDKTAQSFITNLGFLNALGLDPDRRMYRTGDLVKQNQDGSITYLGRSDSQVKLHGQRVEIGEIEYWIAQYLPHIRMAAVDVYQESNQFGDGVRTALIAVLEFTADSGLLSQLTVSTTPELLLHTPSEELRSSIQKLETQLSKALPSYMVPNIFIPITRLPVNASGKLDRGSVRNLLLSLTLTQLQQLRSATVQKVAPSTDAERSIQILWAKALGLEQEVIGANDHFFQIGGDSVTAIRVVSSSQGMFTVSDMFKYPVLADLARHADEKATAASASLTNQPINQFELWKENGRSVTLSGSASLQERIQEIAKECRVEAEEIEDVYPCTPLQESLMAITQRQPAAYTARRIFRLTDSIDIDRFKATWEMVAKMLVILRTRIVVSSANSVALQVVVNAPIPWAYGNSLDTYLADDTKNLITYGAPLMRWAIIDDDSTSHKYFVWTSHHSMYDAWSLQCLFQALLSAYHQDESVPTNIGSFNGYVKYITSDSDDSARDYWKRELEGVSPAVFPPLPSMNYRPSVTETTKRLITFDYGQARSITVSTILKAAWSIVVSRHLGLDEALITTTSSGRTAPVPDIANLIGPTINTLPVRMKIDRQQTIEQFLNDAQDQMMRMMVHEHVGLQKIRRFVPDLENTLGIGHLFIVQTPIERESNTVDAFPGLEHHDTILQDFDSFALNIECTADTEANTIDIQARFDEHVIPKAKLDRLLAQFEKVYCQLRSLKGNQTLGDINTMSDMDKDQIMIWNKDVPPLPTADLLHEKIYAQCQARYENIAVSSWDGKLSYDILWKQAERIAHHIVSLGVGPEIKVGVCMDKSKWVIVAMLAILQAGGTVVPLGVQHPLARIETIIADTGMEMIFVDEMQLNRLKGTVRHTLVPTDSWLEPLPPSPGKVVSKNLPSVSSAWIIYTSGSTGTPKGVVLEHASLCTSLQVHGSLFGLGPDTHGLQFSAFTFDISIADSFGLLYCGGCIHIPSEQDRLNSLTAFMQSARINFAMLTSTVANIIPPDQVPSLKVLAFIGEAPKPDVVEKWQGHARLLNGYGPAECTIGVSVTDITDVHSLNIGYPFAGRFWVTDSSNYNILCPIGAPGELLIEGPLLARGYLNDSQKTADSFVSPGFASKLGLGEGIRMYRTGDLVRQNEDGSITYIGRKDNQVKIRGQRVEIGEIEYWITRLLPDAQMAAVDTFRGSENRELLVAVLELLPQSNLISNRSTVDLSVPEVLSISRPFQDASQEVRMSLLDVLPPYMIPNIFLPISHMPRNPSGKLDRRCVQNLLGSFSPDYMHSLLSSVENTISPVTESEKYIQSLWAKTLGVPLDSIGSNDQFFQLGGDSVIAIRVAAASQGRLTVADIFQHPRLSHLALALDQHAERENRVDAAEIPPFSLWKDADGQVLSSNDVRLQSLAEKCNVNSQDIEDVYPCTPLQESLMAITYQQPLSYVARRVFRLADNVDVQRLQESWAIVAKLTPILRTRIVPMGSSAALQVVVKESLPWIYSRSLKDYLLEDKAKPITYGSPLLRWAIVQEKNSQYFVWTTHHSAYDAWSIQLIFRLLMAVYNEQDTQGLAAPFTRYIKYIQDVDSTATEAFWHNQLEGMAASSFPVLPHPKYTPRVNEQITHSFVGSISRSSVPLSTMLRAAWAMVVDKHLGTGESLLAVTLSGRTASVAGISDLLGPTISTVPVRIRVNGQTTVREYLETIQKQAGNMISHEHVGLQAIRQLVPTMADPGHLFLVQAPIEREDTSMSQFDGFQSYEVDVDGFDSYALNIECTADVETETRTSSVEVQARFDSTVISIGQTERLLAQFEHVFQQLPTSNDTATLEDIQVCSEHDLSQIKAWNDQSESTYNPNKCLHEVIYDQCQDEPDAIAVSA